MNRKTLKAVKSGMGILALSFSLLTATAYADTVPYNYTDRGPETWGSLVHDDGTLAYPTCGTGTSQSPIDLNDAAEAKLDEIKFNYDELELNVLNNGHTLEVEVHNGSHVKIDGTKYRLLQFHFHTPSEHTVEGEAFPMEVHFVHISDAGRIAVVGVLVEEGKANKKFADILANAPHEEGEIEVPGKEISAEDFLPEEEGEEFFRYSGSLTTPPCSEGLLWSVMDETISFSKEQIETFAEFVHGHNARPTQPLFGRVVTKADD